MKLYITPGSPYARMARIVVIEKGLESRVEFRDLRTSSLGHVGTTTTGTTENCSQRPDEVTRPETGGE